MPCGERKKQAKGNKGTKDGDYVEPTLRVRLIKDVRVLPDECLTTQVELEGEMDTSMQPMIIEANPALFRDRRLQMVDVGGATTYQRRYCIGTICLINRFDLGLLKRLKKE